MSSGKAYTERHHSGLQVYGFQALGAAQEAIRKFEAASTPWQRPPDYYAEMVKNDDHMAKVKQQLMHEQEQMEAVEQRYEQALCCCWYTSHKHPPVAIVMVSLLLRVYL